MPIEIASEVKKNFDWSAEDKLAVLRLRQLGMLKKSVSDICREVGLSRKTFYEWLKQYELGGFSALYSTSSSYSKTRSKDLILIEAIKLIALEQPYLGSAPIVRELAKQGLSISAPTVNKILAELGLENTSTRLAATEKAIISGAFSPTETLLETLFRLNPCFEDWHHKGKKISRPVGLDAISLKNISTLKDYYLVYGVDFASLYLFGILIYRKDGELLQQYLDKTIHSMSKAIKKTKISLISGQTPSSLFRIWENKHRYPIPYSSFRLLQNDSHLAKRTIKVMRNLICSSFIHLIQENAKPKEIGNAWEKWITEHNTQPGPSGYPTFGKTPNELLQNLDTFI